MRFMLKYSFPTTEETNAWVRDGTIVQMTQSIFEEIQPEAVYLAPVNGTRGAYLIINMDDASEISTKLEPLFQELGATIIEFFPVMTPEDLRAGLQQRYG
jgi:hypothetical protein